MTERAPWDPATPEYDTEAAVERSMTAWLDANREAVLDRIASAATGASPGLGDAEPDSGPCSLDRDTVVAIYGLLDYVAPHVTDPSVTELVYGGVAAIRRALSASPFFEAQDVRTAQDLVLRFMVDNAGEHGASREAIAQSVCADPIFTIASRPGRGLTADLRSIYRAIDALVHVGYLAPARNASRYVLTDRGHDYYERPPGLREWQQ